MQLSEQNYSKLGHQIEALRRLLATAETLFSTDKEQAGKLKSETIGALATLFAGLAEGDEKLLDAMVKAETLISKLEPVEAEDSIIWQKIFAAKGNKPGDVCEITPEDQKAFDEEKARS